MDVLLIETSQDILEVKAAIFGCREAIRAADRPVAINAELKGAWWQPDGA